MEDGGVSVLRQEEIRIREAEIGFGHKTAR